MNTLLKLVLMFCLCIFALLESANANPMPEEVRAAYGKKNFSKVVKLCKPLADKGDPEAQFVLGMLYFKGEGLQKDLNEAARWYRRSADQGHSFAQSALALLYYTGQGVEKNYGEAMKWARLAAEQGGPAAEAEYLLGEIYWHGLGIPLDYLEGVKWYRQAAEKGHVDAQLMLVSWYSTWGYAIYSGLHPNAKIEDIPKEYLDSEEVEKWDRKAAEQGSPQAQFSVGVSYLRRDLAEAIKWFRRAAVQGYSDAQSALGEHYATGEGVPQDYVKAYMWLNMAAVTGDAIFFKKLADRRDALAAKMTPQQIAEGQRLSRECPARKYEGC